MIEIKGSKGLGDAIYLRAVVLHLLDQGHRVTVYTPWPVMFEDLAVKIRPVAACEGLASLRFAAYSTARTNPDGISNFEAACGKAQIKEPVALRLDWKVSRPQLVEQILTKAAGRKIFVYQPPKRPHNPEQELLRPTRKVYNQFVADHADHYRIKLGQAPYVDEDAGAPCELDLFGKASIRDAFDIGTVGDLFFGESCYVPMLGEAMDKRFAVMFTRRALNSDTRVRNLTPERLFHKKHLGTAVYDES